jgi:RNA polymerase sigma-70 factor (ECF subfamily)
MSEEDLAQTVYLKVFAKLHQFSGRVPLKHWVSRIAVNTCYNVLRSERTRTELRMSDLSEEQHAVVQHLAVSSEELPGGRSQSARELVQAILARLKPEERLVINLLHIEEWSVEEISHKTGWSLSRVKVKAFRARQKMRKHLKTLLTDHQEEDSAFAWSGALLDGMPSLA